MIELANGISVNESELSEQFIRAPGPGGQHVNKVSTAVQLRFDIANCESFSEQLKERLIKACGRRATKEGVLVITANRFRSQEQNRADALDRLNALVEKANHVPVRRRPTKPSRASKQKRLSQKRVRSSVKKLRRSSQVEDDE